MTDPSLFLGASVRGTVRELTSTGDVKAAGRSDYAVKNYALHDYGNPR